MKFKTRHFLISIIAIIIALIIVFIIRQGRFYPSGILGISLSLSELINKIWVYPLFMLCLNLPLAVFSYFKMGWKFTGLTVTFLITNVAAYLLFSNIIPFNISLFRPSDILHDTGTKVMAAVIAGAIYGVANSTTYMLKGSAGGTDFLSTYFAKKNRNYGVYNMIIGVSIVFIIVFFAVFLKVGLEEGNWSFYNIFNNTLFLTILFIGTSSIAIHYSYPRYIKVAVKIFTSKGYQISRSLIHRNYPHKHTVTIVKSPLSNRNKTEIYIVVFYHQYVDLLNRVNNIDDKAFVTVTKLSQVKGYLTPPKLN